MISTKNLKIPQNAANFTDNLSAKITESVIDAALYIPPEQYIHSKKMPLIIFVHGFKGFKDWGGFPYMCRKLAESGFYVLSFNFSHNGVKEPENESFTRLDLFADNTHSIELADLKSVIDYLPALKKDHKIDTDNYGIIGHSRGGGISLISAFENSEIKAIATLASVAYFSRYTDEQIKKWEEKGYIEIPNTRTNQMMRMNISLLNDIHTNRDRLNLLNAAAHLNKPLLIVHGKEDLAVKYTDAEKIYNSSDKDLTEINIIENTGHTFGIEHPFKGTTKAFENVIELLKDFFTSRLKVN